MATLALERTGCPVSLGAPIWEFRALPAAEKGCGALTPGFLLQLGS